MLVKITRARAIVGSGLEQVLVLTIDLLGGLEQELLLPLVHQEDGTRSEALESREHQGGRSWPEGRGRGAEKLGISLLGSCPFL